LIIDEAQSLPYELLEEIRLLANIETTRDKLLPIVLAGQPELAERLNQASLRQLKQRVGLRCLLRQLELAETGAYITARVSVAGGVASTLFTREAVIVIHERSQGIPRLISVLCHNSLINAFALTQKPVTADIVREVCEDFDLGGGPSLITALPKSPMPAASQPAPVPPRHAPRDMFSGLVKPRRRYSIFREG
jgi:type II secretory pathway predicted ATPase ExeA